MKLTFERIHVTTTHPFRIARETQTGRDVAIVEIEADGLVGLGESSPPPYYGETIESAMAALHGLGKHLSGDVKGIQLSLNSGELRQQLNANASVRAALDMALWDLRGQREEKPLYEMLGLDPANTPATSYSLGIDSPDVIQHKLDEASSFRLIKMKMGVPGDMALLDVVLASGDRRVRVDANEGWDIETAIGMSRELHEKGVELIEQPMHHDQEEDLRELKRLSPLPIILDESIILPGDARRKRDQGHGVNVKLMKCGGITPALQLINEARHAGLSTMLGCMLETSLGITAAAHLSPLVDYADLDGNLLLADDPFIGVTTDRGKLVLPDGFGLGVTRR
jgi:L-alanine-DL-glutamate epimerase-like enolase superfamily enzyme